MLNSIIKFKKIQNIAGLTLQCEEQTPWNQQTVTHVNFKDFIETGKPHLHSGNATSIGSNPGPQVCTFLGYGSCDSRAYKRQQSI